MEKWKLIEESNNRYEISNYGKVRKIKEIIFRCNGRRQIINENILTPVKNNKGYFKVRCNIKIGKVKNIYVHRLVAKYFIYKQEDGLQVNHIDGNKANNHYKNLEWVTGKENIIHAWKTGLSNNNHFKHKVTINNIEFESKNEAANFFGITRFKLYNLLKTKDYLNTGKIFFERI